MNDYTKPQLMRQIADAMEKDPDGWWRGFEVYINEWEPPVCYEVVVHHALTGDIRRRPRTIRIDVEVPEPMRKVPEEGQRFWSIDTLEQNTVSQFVWADSLICQRLFTQGIWPTQHEAQQVADAIFGALGRKHD